MTAVRPWAEVAADLRERGFSLEKRVNRIAREAADLIEALAAERDAAQAVIAEVRAALDRYETGRYHRPGAAKECVSAIAKAVRGD